MSIHPTAFIHPQAFVCGSVTLGAHASVWPTAVVRGDTAPIVIGEETNVQDGTVVHVDPGVPCTIGARVAIGHRAIVHGATVEDECLIAMGAILLNRVHVGSGSIHPRSRAVHWRRVLSPTAPPPRNPRGARSSRRRRARSRRAHTPPVRTPAAASHNP